MARMMDQRRIDGRAAGDALSGHGSLTRSDNRVYYDDARLRAIADSERAYRSVEMTRPMTSSKTTLRPNMVGSAWGVGGPGLPGNGAGGYRVQKGGPA